MTELLTYIEPAIVVRIRKSGKYNRYIYPMKVCTRSDFDKKGFEMNEPFAESLNTRLCPDVPANDQNYEVKNLY